jgi:hypothetical protein
MIHIFEENAWEWKRSYNSLNKTQHSVSPDVHHLCFHVDTVTGSFMVNTEMQVYALARYAL